MINSEKAQAVINTLAQLTIPATFENVNRMTGIYQTMFGLRDDLAKEEKSRETVQLFADGEMIAEEVSEDG